MKKFLELCEMVPFQYHTGSIKSITERALREVGCDCFNTTLVQLKVRASFLSLSSITKFQYHTGSIKRGSYGAYEQCKRPGFNTTLVQLKVGRGTPEPTVCNPLPLVSIPHWFN